MSRPIAILRPQPANEATAAAIEARGGTVIRLPLFETRPVAWEAPDPAQFDALILTSANTLRNGGAQLERYRALPVYAVGAPTAKAARAAGFTVAATGTSDGVALLSIAAAQGVARALHLGGRERKVHAGGIVAEALAIYVSEALSPAPEAFDQLRGTIVLLHSPRAARLLSSQIDTALRPTIAVVAISDAAARAAGDGWEQVIVADAPSNKAMTDHAFALFD